MMRALLSAIVPAVLLGACGEPATAPSTSTASDTAEAVSGKVTTLDAAELEAMIAQDEAILVDVRTPEEFVAGHLEGAINLPVETFEPGEVPIAGEGKEVILYCRSDRRSGIAAEQLAEARGTTVRHLDGGILAWEDAGNPVTEAAR